MRVRRSSHCCCRCYCSSSDNFFFFLPNEVSPTREVWNLGTMRVIVLVCGEIWGGVQRAKKREPGWGIGGCGRVCVCVRGAWWMEANAIFGIGGALGWIWSGLI